MRTIAIDLLGGDNGPEVILEAVKSFLQDNKDYKFILVGDKKQVTKFFPDETINVEIVDCPTLVKGELGARAARGEPSSMSVAVTLVRDQKADLVMSAGNSAAYLALSTLILHRMPGIKRPAFMPIIPTVVRGRQFVMLDAGANLEVSAEVLVQWALLGNAFSETVMGIDEPRISLLNVGTEEEKGFEWMREANKTLRGMEELNYQGFIEARDMLKGEVDVVVVDGYGGNMVLKSLEGTAQAINTLIKNSLRAKPIYTLGALLARGAFDIVRETFDYRNVGVAWVIGLTSLAAKAHGSSDTKAFVGALNHIKLVLEKDAMEAFRKAVPANE